MPAFSYRELHNRDPEVALMTNDFSSMLGSEIIILFKICLPTTVLLSPLMVPEMVLLLTVATQ